MAFFHRRNKEADDDDIGEKVSNDHELLVCEIKGEKSDKSLSKSILNIRH